MAAEIHVGDVGTNLVIAVVDEDGAIVDVSAATVRTIYLIAPNGVISAHTAVNDTTGTDGLIRYNTAANTTVPTDFNMSGNWEIEGYVTVGADTWSTESTVFYVGPSARWPGL